MRFYKYKEHILVSKEALDITIKEVSESDIEAYKGTIYFVDKKDPLKFNRRMKLYDSSYLDIQEEDLNILRKTSPKAKEVLPEVLLRAIKENRAVYVNSNYKNWIDVLDIKEKNKWKVNVVGLGDVGGTLITGLRMMGGDCIETIGIYDKDESKIKRWCFEGNQILDINNPIHPEIKALTENELFNCDMFVFCVSVGVPEVGKEVKDVRLIQFEGNSKIVSYYAKKAREANFKGIFAVVSDPVDLLCKVVFNESNKDEDGNFDFMGLGSDQIRGYGLGVMNGRANYFAIQKEETKNYLKEGRAFGPHGEGLIIANSLENYDEKLSNELTENTKKANLEVRSTGFKPYIAPALSSGSISLLSTIRGEFHYSANFIGGTFIGCKNRYSILGTEFERYDFNESLFNKLQNTYNYLNSIYY